MPTPSFFGQSLAVFTSPRAVFDRSAFTTARIDPAVARWQSSRYFGADRIAGTVRVLTATAPNRTVRLYDRLSGRLAFETVSAADGTYSFPAVFAGRQYYAIALDIQPGGYNATIEDLVVPA